MFLHLGNDCVVRKKNIIGVFDLENTSVSKDTKEFLNNASKRKEVKYLTSEIPKAFIVTEENGKSETYISLVSSQTLRKRANSRISTIV